MRRQCWHVAPQLSSAQCKANPSATLWQQCALIFDVIEMSRCLESAMMSLNASSLKELGSHSRAMCYPHRNSYETTRARLRTCYRINISNCELLSIFCFVSLLSDGEYVPRGTGIAILRRVHRVIVLFVVVDIDLTLIFV
jgi:hypothetical protein